MDKFWERYITSRPAPGESKGAFEAFAAAHMDPGPRNMAHGGRIIGKPGGLVEPGVEYYGATKFLPQIVKAGNYLKNLLVSRTPYTGAEKIGVSTTKTDWTTEKTFTTKFQEYADKHFGGNWSAASKSLGEDRNKIRGIFQRLAKHETGIHSYGKIGTGSEMRVNIPEPKKGIAYKNATTFAKKDSNFFKKFITEENTGQFLSPREIGHSLGIKFKNKSELDSFVADLKRFNVESQHYSGKQSLYNFDDAVGKITEGYRKKLVKGDRLSNSKRIEIENRLDAPLFKLRNKIQQQVSRVSKNENIYLQRAIDDLGHAVSIKITDKYPKLFKNSTVNRINSLVYQDPYINQDVMKITGYETRFDSMFKELDSLVNKPVTTKTQLRILDIKQDMLTNYNNLIETISNPKKLKMVMEDAGKEISLSHLKNISTQTNRIPKIDVNVPKIGSTFKSSDIYVDMSKVDSAYIMGHVNQINPTAKYFKDLSLSEKALYEANMKEQTAGILENYYKKAKFPKEQIDELRETLTYDYAKGGRVGLKDGTEVRTLETPIKNELKKIGGKDRLIQIMNGSKATKPEIGIIKKIMGHTGKLLKGTLNPMEWIRLRNWIGKEALAFFGGIELGMAKYDQLEKGTPWKEALSNTLFGYLMKDPIEYQVEDPKLQKYLTPGAKKFATAIKLLSERKQLNSELDFMKTGGGRVPKSNTKELYYKRKEIEKKEKEITDLALTNSDVDRILEQHGLYINPSFKSDKDLTFLKEVTYDDVKQELYEPAIKKLTPLFEPTSGIALEYQAGVTEKQATELTRETPKEERKWLKPDRESWYPGKWFDFLGDKTEGRFTGFSELKPKITHVPQYNLPPSIIGKKDFFANVPYYQGIPGQLPMGPISGRSTAPIKNYTPRTYQSIKDARISPKLTDPNLRRGVASALYKDRWRRMILEPGMLGTQDKFAGGGIVGIRKPNAIAPTGGPMSQGLRSLYNNVKKS